MRRLSASIALIVWVAVLAGCGDAGDDPGRTSHSSSSYLTKADFVERMASAIRHAGSAHSTVKIVSSGQSLTGEGNLIFGTSADSSAMDVAYVAGGFKYQVRIVNSLVYVNYGKATDYKYFKIDPKHDKSLLAKRFSGLLDQMDPATSYQPMRKAIVSVRQRSGAPRISGVRTIPYEVVIDTDKVAGLPAFAGIPRSQLPDKFTYVFYMDEVDLARKISLRVEGTEMEMEYSDFGKVPAIKPPPESEITTKEPFTSSI